MLQVCICISQNEAVTGLCLLHYIEYDQCHLQLQLANLMKSHKGYVSFRYAEDMGAVYSAASLRLVIAQVKQRVILQSLPSFVKVPH